MPKTNQNHDATLDFDLREMAIHNGYKRNKKNLHTGGFAAWNVLDSNQ